MQRAGDDWLPQAVQYQIGSRGRLQYSGTHFTFLGTTLYSLVHFAIGADGLKAWVLRYPNDPKSAAIDFVIAKL